MIVLQKEREQLRLKHGQGERRGRRRRAGGSIAWQATHEQLIHRLEEPFDAPSPSRDADLGED